MPFSQCRNLTLVQRYLASKTCVGLVKKLISYEEDEMLEKIQQGRLRVKYFVESTVNKRISYFWRQLGFE